MEEKGKVEQLAGNVKAYVETRFDLELLNMQLKLTGMVSSAASMLLVGFCIILALLFISIGAAWAIGDAFNNFSIGFFIVAAFYLLVMAIIYMNRETWVKTPLINAMLKKINFNEND